MGNIIKIKHGNRIPIPENLENYELGYVGYGHNGLYIKDNGQIICLNGTDSLQGIIPIKKGGTGASSTFAACKNLGAARVQAPNNLIHNGDEFTFIPRDFNGDLWFNYSAYNGTGEISSYIFGKGKQTSKDNYASIYIKQVISAAATGVSWSQGRNKATVRNFIKKDSGFHPVVTSQSNQGYWSLGSIGDDTSNCFHFSYVTDADYNAGDNISTNCYITPNAQFSGTAANVYGTVEVANGGTGMNSAYTFGSVSAANNASYSSVAVKKYYNGLIFYGFTMKLGSMLSPDATRSIGTASIKPAGKAAVLATSTAGSAGSYDTYDISIRISAAGVILISNNGSERIPDDVTIHAAGVGLAD